MHKPSSAGRQADGHGGKPRGGEGWFRCLVENAPDVIMILEADLTVRYVCPSVEQVLGYRPGDVVGTRLCRYLHPGEHEWVRGGLVGRHVESERVPTPVRLRIRHADGSWRHFEAVGTDLLDDASLGGIATYFHDVTEDEALRDELVHRSLHDPLTGLPNRALFMDRLGHALARAGRHRGPVTVLFLDLDDFKTINDSFGHEMGDLLLVAMGRRLKACVRPGDTVARLGGDEFAVLLEDSTGAIDVARAVERVAEASRAPIVLGGHRLFATASIGVARSDREQDRTEDLLRQADLAMYRAKEKGKARLELLERSASEGALGRARLEQDLKGALERGELRVYYQPEVALGSGEIVGMEALLRWEYPRRGLLLPAEFVTLAEMNGLIGPIGRWILEEACRQALLWQDQYPDAPPAVSVNLSTKQLRRSTLAEEVAVALQKTGLTPRNLVLEVTESLSTNDASRATATVRELEGLGVRLAVDDFGNRGSSFSYLEGFPVDALKIDRSFVGKLGRDSASATRLVSAMIGFARAMGIRTVAEGVETAEQLDELLGMGCDSAQGFYFCKPLPGNAATELLKSNRGP